MFKYFSLLILFSLQVGAHPKATPWMKAAEWRACHQNQTHRLFSAGEEEGLVSQFVESSQVITDLEEMNRRALFRGQVSVSPWSGDYWPYASGLIASRYQDSGFNQEYTWRDKRKYIQDNPLSKVINDQGQEGVNTLSPAEKYDLLTGSEDSLLAQSMWKQGERYEDDEGDVETWMGICHGWAPAAIMEPRPSKKVQVRSLDSKWNLSFVPSEIKGLLSYSWATNRYPHLSLGSRCEEKDPKRDENGRLIDPRCQDLNPGIWHQVVVNMVGRQKRSFVMDATFDYEVWNQPVKAYSYRYFNLNTEEMTMRFQDALLKTSEVENDKFKSYRSSRAQYLIGVEMVLSYVSETRANNLEEDSETKDSVISVTYRYDLELDSSYHIVGGEWYSEAHPDFVWTPKKQALPLSGFDYALGVTNWLPEKETLPVGWSVVAQTASPYGTLIHRIVKELAERSY